MASRQIGLVGLWDCVAFELVWVNLFYNSAPVFWYLSRVPWGKAYSSNELKQMVENEGLP